MRGLVSSLAHQVRNAADGGHKPAGRMQSEQTEEHRMNSLVLTRPEGCYQFICLAYRSPEAIRDALIDTALGLPIKQVAFSTELGFAYVTLCRYHVDGTVRYLAGRIIINLHLCTSDFIASVRDSARYVYPDTNDLSESAQDAAYRFWRRASPLNVHP
jgi:hypothetical protein